GQSDLDFAKLLFDPASDLQRILALAHQDHAAGDLVAVLFQNAPARLRRQARAGQVSNSNPSPAGIRNDDVFKILNDLGLSAVLVAFRGIAQQADAANQELRICLENNVAADRRVGSSEPIDKAFQRDSFGSQADRINVYQILHGVTANAGDFRDSGNRIELVANVPVLDRSQPAQIVTGSLHGVPEDLARGRRIRTQSRRDS